MGYYQQSDSLSTVTDLPPSGTGSSTRQAPANDADYAAWRWEVVLSTVLGIGVPDRTEVTGQPWLTIGHDGQGGAGAHLIWTADWHTGPASAGKSLQVYLNPALYTAGGAWDRFFNAPPQALAGVPSGNYGGLPLVPPTFAAASSEIATVTNWIGSAADRFDTMHNEATSGPIAEFQGNLAGVVAELLASLRTVMLSVHDQMTYPTSYSDSIAAAGNSATTFLTDVLSAHSSWAQLIEHSPLGAVVKVLEGIATLDSSGNYVIADPQNTPFGDLTVDGSWTAVEQQAKNLWTGTLIGGSGNFTGLDLLGRTALGKLVSQFGVTTGTIVPVAGPGRPSPRPNPVNPHQVDATHNPGGGGPGGGGTGSPGAPHPGPNAEFVLPGTGHPNGGAVDLRGGPSGAGPSLAHQANLAVRLGGPGPMPVGLIPTGLAGPSLKGTAVPGPAGLGRVGALGAPPGVTGSPSDAVPPVGRGLPGFPEPGAGIVGFTGTIGSPKAASGRNGDRGKHGGRGKKVLATMPTAPSPGFSLGSDPGGAVLKRSAVPILAAKPPAVTSSFVNLQPVPGQGGPTQATAPGANLQVDGQGTPPPVIDGGVIGPGMITPDEPGGVDGSGAPGEPGLLPMGVGGAGGGLGRPERERLAYLPEEAEYWGTRPELATSSLQAAARQPSAEPDFEPAESRLSAIGAQAEFTPGNTPSQIGERDE